MHKRAIIRCYSSLYTGYTQKAVYPYKNQAKTVYAVIYAAAV